MNWSEQLRPIVYLLTICIVLIANVAFAAGPRQFMGGLQKQIRVALVKGDVAKANELFVEYVDMIQLSKRSLIDHWDSFDKEERIRFSSLLNRVLRKQMREKMMLTGDDTDFVLVFNRTKKLKSGVIRVDNLLKTSKGNFKLTLFLVRENRSYRIVDYELSGALLSRNYRSHFNYIIRNHGKSGLFERMERKLTK